MYDKLLKPRQSFRITYIFMWRPVASADRRQHFGSTRYIQPSFYAEDWDRMFLQRQVSIFKERVIFKTAYYSELSLIGWWAVTSLAPRISADTTLPLKEVASIYFLVFHNALNEPSCAKDVKLFAVNRANKCDKLTIISSTHTKSI